MYIRKFYAFFVRMLEILMIFTLINYTFIGLINLEQRMVAEVLCWLWEVGSFVQKEELGMVAS